MTTPNNSNEKPLRSAILTVGTELVEGQILNRNAQWISAQLRDQGFEIARHETVPDDRTQIREALDRMAASCDLLFITGGLGPTSDDFTRELVAEWVAQPLEWNEPSWQHIVTRLTQFGIVVAESNRQQCYFPKTAEILVNREGTASGFALRKSGTRAWILPGPPRELEAIWKDHVESALKPLAPRSGNKILFTWRCIGKSEAAMGELVDGLLKGSGLEVGYRAHLPYVEVKVWCEKEKHAQSAMVLEKLTETLNPWLISRDAEDIAETFMSLLPADRAICIHDSATEGYLAERLGSLPRKEKLNFSLITHYGASAESPHAQALSFSIGPISPEGAWAITFKDGAKTQEQELRSPYRFSAALRERNRKLSGELSLFHFVKWLRA